MEYEQKEYEALADFNSESMGPPSSEISYISFKKGDILISAAKYENGWIFGALKEKIESQGFFPSNYLKLIEKNEVKQESEEEKENNEENNEKSLENDENSEKNEENEEINEIDEKNEENDEKNEEKQEKPIENVNKRKAVGSWMDFVKDIISEDQNQDPAGLPKKRNEISEQDILNEALVQENYNSIIGYKKIRITNDPNQALKKLPGFVGNNNNPTPVLNNEFAMVFLLFFFFFLLKIRLFFNKNN